MFETKTRKLIDLINEAKAKDLAERKRESEAFIPQHAELFVEFFGIEPDSAYYNEELDRLVFRSGSLEVAFTGCLEDNWEYRKQNKWGMVWTCSDCGRKFREDYGASSWRYLHPEMPRYIHNHDDPQVDLIGYLRQALGIGQDA